jgi:Leucine-rich repeat (LRR) protein
MLFITSTMSRLGFFVILIASMSGVGSCERFSADPVQIPDVAFLEGLLELGIDRNNDGIVSTWEAEKVQKIELWPRGIGNLIGIEAFVNLDTLSVYLNPIDTVDLTSNRSLRFVELIGCGLSFLNVRQNATLTYLDCSGTALRPNVLEDLDLSANTALVYLDCSYNHLDHLNLQFNIGLRYLACGRNRLESLETSELSLLEKFYCNNNALTALDLAKNTALETLISCGNRLTVLDISRNIRLKKIGIDNMPMLEEVCVWRMPFPPDGVEILSGFSPNIVFLVDC